MSDELLHPPLFGAFGALKIVQVDAQKQARTPRDVKVAWLRPKVPSKLNGRKGTRRGWKRRNAPHWLLAYREPTDVLVLNNETIIATPTQYAALRAAQEIGK